MRFGACIAVLLVATSVFAQSADSRNSTAPSTIEQAGLAVYWEANLPVGAGESLEAGYLVDDCLYVVSDGGTVFSLHPDSGLLRWGSVVTDPAYTVFKPGHVQRADRRGPVIIPTSTEVYIKDRYTGDDMLRFKPDFPLGSPAAGFDNVLLLGSNNGRMYAMEWDTARPGHVVQRWDVATGGGISAAPVLYPPRNLLFASQSGGVFSCQAANKLLAWDYKVGGPVKADPAVDAGGAYIASLDRSLYKLHLRTGKLLWRARFPDPLEQGPAVAGQTVFQFTPTQGVTALDAMTGEEKWRRPDAAQFASHGATGDALLVPSDKLLIVDHQSGRLLFTVMVPPSRAAVTNSINDSIYLLGQAGRVLCLRRDTVPYLRRQQVLMTQESLNTPPTPVRPEARVAPPAPPPPPREDPFRSRKDRDPVQPATP